MRVLCSSIYAALCFALVTAGNLGPLESCVQIGNTEEPNESPSPQEVQAAHNVIGLLEYVRRLMPVGINNFLGVMEPYTKDELAPVKFEDENGRLKGEVTLTNLVASGAQHFTIHSIGVSVDSEQLEFNVSVPEIVVDVDFEGIDLDLDDILVFNTSGSLHIVLTELDVVGEFKVGHEYDLAHYVVVGMHVKNAVDDVEVNVKGHIPEDIVDEVKDSVMTAVAETAMEELTGILSHFTVEQVKAFLEV